MSPHKQELAYQRRILLISITSLAVIVFLAGYFVSRVDQADANVFGQPELTPDSPTPLPGERQQYAPVLLSPENFDNLGTGSIELKGTGPAGFRVRALIDNRDAGETFVADDNMWTLTIDLPQPGDYELSLVSVTLNGDIAAQSALIRITVDDFD